MSDLISSSMVARSRIVSDPRWSPDGRHLSWLSAFDGRVDLMVAPVPDGPATVVTSDVGVSYTGVRSGGGYAWAGPDELVVATDDGQVVVLAANGGPPLRVLSAQPSASAPVVSSLGLVAFSREDEQSCEVVVVSVDGSTESHAVSNADYAWDPAFSPDGRTLVWHEWDLPDMPWDGSRISRCEIDRSGCPRRPPELLAGGADTSVGQPRFSPDGAWISYVSDATGWANVWIVERDGSGARPVVDEPFEHAEPSWGPGQRSYAWAPESSRLALCRNEAGFGRLLTVDVSETAGSARQPVELAKAWHRGLHWGARGLTAVRTGARTPDQVVVYDGDGRRSSIARGPVGGFEAAGLSEPRIESWPGGDSTVQGLFYPPASSAPASNRPPLLVDVHGGPTGQAVVEWRARVAYWNARGWAVLRPNHRGSTGYGRRFVEALRGGWGDLDVADIAAGIRHLVDTERVDGRSVAITGSSAGGMAAMLLCIRHPDLVSAGVSVCGVADLFALARSTHRFESRYLDGLVGALPAAAERYRERSVVTHASELRVPLLVLAGSEDEVVPPDQAEQLVEDARAAGVDVEYHLYQGEGHGLRRLESIIDELDRTDRFLRARVLS